LVRANVRATTIFRIFELFNVQMYKMAAINFRLRSESDKNVSIYIHLTLGRGKIFETPTGFYINPKYWKKDSKYGFPKNSNFAEIKNIKNSLLKLQSFIDTEINNAQSNGELINTQWLKGQIDNCFNRDVKIEKESNLLTDYIQKIIDDADTKVLQGGKIGLSKNRVKGYVTFKGIIEKYQKHIKKEIDFKDIDINFEDDFRNWLIKEQGYSINYAGKNFDNLKAVCNEALRTGRKVNEHANHIKSFTESKEDKEVITLSFDELDVISNLNDLSTSLENVRKWLLLGCEIGQRGGDLLNITENNFVTRKGIKYIDIKQQKTGKTVTIPVREKVNQILKTGLPYKISMQKFNIYLKDLCQIAEIDEQIKGKVYDKKKKRKALKLYPKYQLITSHTCRRSFATNYYKQIPTPVLMVITGHSKESLFLTYIGQKEDKDANANLMLEYAEIMEQKRKELKAKEKTEKRAKMEVIKKVN